MIIPITDASHTRKTLLAQKMLEKYKYPYLSSDHLKIGLIQQPVVRNGRQGTMGYAIFHILWYNGHLSCSLRYVCSIVHKIHYHQQINSKCRKKMSTKQKEESLMNETGKVILIVLMFFYLISPLDLAPGPVDDFLVILIGIAAQKRIGRTETA